MERYTWLRDRKNRIYGIWSDMKGRCDRKSHKYYMNYGWRWITYCEEWSSFDSFRNDMKEWYNGTLTIDRIDNNWNYCKENCKWSTRTEQNRNRRDSIIYQGKHIADWCDELWLSYDSVRQRIWKWRDIEDALNMPNNYRIKTIKWKNIKDWCKLAWVKYPTVLYRVNQWMGLEDAINKKSWLKERFICNI